MGYHEGGLRAIELDLQVFLIWRTSKKKVKRRKFSKKKRKKNRKSKNIGKIVYPNPKSQLELKLQRGST